MDLAPCVFPGRDASPEPLLGEHNREETVCVDGGIKLVSFLSLASLRSVLVA